MTRLPHRIRSDNEGAKKKIFWVTKGEDENWQVMGPQFLGADVTPKQQAVPISSSRVLDAKQNAIYFDLITQLASFFRCEK
ncbi:unnamed protein product [Caenorhabditis auriculariae]|uniref:Uncharacterized protein n=1 Tax=Caenorhabditis auriculariae TaxID=2777116 RepID=A0A8S1HJG2_9PELO|nr:unnamed protein product [Caenorhabditis auriculariae]